MSPVRRSSVFSFAEKSDAYALDCTVGHPCAAAAPPGPVVAPVVRRVGS